MWIGIGLTVATIASLIWVARSRRDTGSYVLGSISQQWLNEHGAHYRDGSR